MSCWATAKMSVSLSTMSLYSFTTFVLLLLIIIISIAFIILYGIFRHRNISCLFSIPVQQKAFKVHFISSVLPFYHITIDYSFLRFHNHFKWMTIFILKQSTITKQWVQNNRIKPCKGIKSGPNEKWEVRE